MNPRPRLAVLGLDGLPHSLPLKLACFCPNLIEAMRLYVSHPIAAELPEVSPVNWTSFSTAENPGGHGVFGFTAIDPANYELSFADSNHIRCETIFDKLGKAGLTSKVINMPNAYPAKPIKGLMVAGFMAADFDRAIHPPFMRAHLRRAGYLIEADTVKGSKDPEFLLADITRTLRGRQRALEMLWPDLAWDLFILVLTETDRLFHFQFPALLDENHPIHPLCADFIRKWDNLIGEFLNGYHRLPEPKGLMILADHGFTALKTEVDVNFWLKRNGFLRLAHPPACNHSDELNTRLILPATRAFALDPGRICVHSRERFKNGSYSRTDARKIVLDIKCGLQELHFQGEKVFERIYTPEEIYHGPYLNDAPDLVCLAKPGFDLKAKFNRDEQFGLYGRRGTHTADDAFFLHHGLQTNVAKVTDAGKSVLEFFGVRGEGLCPSNPQGGFAP